MRILFLLPMVVLVTFTRAQPAGWDEVYRQGQQLLLDDKVAEAIALFEREVRRAPAFDAARYALGDAHRFLALQLAVKGPSRDAERRRHLEMAATEFRWVAARAGDYRPLAAGHLMRLYDEDELDRPGEAATFARMYVTLRPASAVGHVQLARMLRRTGEVAAGTQALLAARAVVSPDDLPLLATSIVDHLVQAPSMAVADVRALLDVAQPVLDEAIARDPRDRHVLLARTAALKLRAERVESDPQRKARLEAEADSAFERFRDANATRAPTDAAAPPPDPDPLAEPPGFAAARDEAEALSTRKEFTRAAAVYETFVRSHPAFMPAHYLRLGALLAAGRPDEIDAALEAARRSVPATADLRYAMVPYLVELEMRTPTLVAADARKLLAEAGLLLDEALSLEPDFYEAIVYKSLVLKRQARIERDPDTAKRLSAEAEQLRARADALARQRR